MRRISTLVAHRTLHGPCAHVVYQIHLRKDGLCSTTSMSTTAALKSGNQLWGIYHTDQEYAHAMGDPLRIVVEHSRQNCHRGNRGAPRIRRTLSASRLIRSKRSERSGFLSGDQTTGNYSPTNLHAASTSEHANTNDSSNPNRHPSVETVRWKYQSHRDWQSKPLKSQESGLFFLSR